jgi:hypothetical protein
MENRLSRDLEAGFKLWSSRGKTAKRTMAEHAGYIEDLKIGDRAERATLIIAEMVRQFAVFSGTPPIPGGSILPVAFLARTDAAGWAFIATTILRPILSEV